MRSKSTLFFSKIYQRRFVLRERLCITEKAKYINFYYANR